MGNPLKKNMDQHTKQKVAIYKAYLDRYLKIISPRGSQINIYDPCAGKGMYGSIPGSAVTACELIQKNIESNSSSRMALYLNELDSENRKSLKRHCTSSFIKCIEGLDVNNFINKYCHHGKNTHSLWFIDPYGYTQVKNNSIYKIINQPYSEVLLFIPLTFIYRFLTGNLENKKLTSIASFLESYSISQKEAQNCQSPVSFANLISQKIQQQQQNKYSGHATMQENGNFYSLFFIGSHCYGLEKFLEARDLILKDDSSKQLSFIPVGKEQELLDIISKNEPLNNYEMYLLGLRNGYAPKQAREHLIQLESRHLIHVQNVSKKKRTSKAFYLNKQAEIRIKISTQE